MIDLTTASIFTSIISINLFVLLVIEAIKKADKIEITITLLELLISVSVSIIFITALLS